MEPCRLDSDSGCPSGSLNATGGVGRVGKLKTPATLLLRRASPAPHARYATSILDHPRLIFLSSREVGTSVTRHPQSFGLSIQIQRVRQMCWFTPHPTSTWNR